MSDTLFPLSESKPDALTEARSRLKKAEDHFAEANELAHAAELERINAGREFTIAIQTLADIEAAAMKSL